MWEHIPWRQNVGIILGLSLKDVALTIAADTGPRE